MRPGAFIMFAVLVGCLPGADDTWAMRSRIFCDPALGIAFHYDYGSRIIDQYKGDLRRSGSRPGAGGGEITEMVVNGKKVKVMMAPPTSGGADVQVVSALGTDAEGDLQAIANRLASERISTWTSWDYYQDPEHRAHAKVTWAPTGVEALIGEGKEHVALILRSGGKVAGVVSTGTWSEADNALIRDSLELLIVPTRAKKGSAPMTWREAQTYQGLVIDADGRSVKPTGQEIPVAWKRAWEAETAHYHVTSQVSPQRLLQYAAYLEGLYDAYVKVYAPDAFPPYKMEIHVFNTQRDFMQAAGSHGFPVGQTTGGFFVPSLLSIFAYEESRKWGGEDFSVEHVLAHECSHQFLHVTCNGSDNVPTWINEGLAVYFENGSFQDGNFQIRLPKDRITRLKMLYNQEKTTLAPLDSYLEHKGHIAPDQYGEVFAVTHFFIFGACKGTSCKHDEKTGCGLYRFRAFWKSLKNGEEGAASFERLFMDAMVKAQNGDRDAAIAVWTAAVLGYVKAMR